jgi:ferredoxin
VTRRILIDRSICIGAATCTRLARGTFALDEERVAVVLDPHGDDDETVEAASSSCPSGAIEITDE